MTRKVIVFVHGLGGWGPDENILDYWDSSLLQTHFEDSLVYIASVGAISSNWDRACELYYQIKGGIVDYGEHHSAKYQHKRWGKTHKGFYPEWSQDKPIVLIGHSMGGQTIRALEKLLHLGDPMERRVSGDNVSELFRGDSKSRIESLVTISTPHLGSPLFDKVGPYLTDRIKDYILKTGAAINGFPGFNTFYDMDIDHFDINKNDYETWHEYRRRVKNNVVWSRDYKDISSWDLSPNGSREFNESSPAVYPRTKYLAISTYSTWRIPLLGLHIPKFSTLPWLKFPGAFMGEPNDGLVPLASSRGPVSSIKWKPGDSVECSMWYYHDVNLDHMQVLGVFTIFGDAKVANCYQTINRFLDCD